MRRFTSGLAVGLIATASIAALPVFAQSDNDQSSDSASGQSMNGQSQNQGQSQSQNGAGGQMAQSGPGGQSSQGGPSGSMGPSGKPMSGHGPAGHRPPPPPPSAEPLANGNPLRHVCLNKSDAYSPGAVVQMQQKAYRCQALPQDSSGVLHWVPMKDDS